MSGLLDPGAGALATPDLARAELSRLVDAWEARPLGERHDVAIVANRLRDAADLIDWWERYRAQYGDRPTQWSCSVAKALAWLEERVFATKPIERPKDLPYDAKNHERWREPIVDDGDGPGARRRYR